MSAAFLVAATPLVAVKSSAAAVTSYRNSRCSSASRCTSNRSVSGHASGLTGAGADTSASIAAECTWTNEAAVPSSRLSSATDPSATSLRTAWRIQPCHRTG